MELTRACGVSGDLVEIVVATDLHEPHSSSEIEELVGREVASEYRVYSHDSDDDANLKHLGKTSFGTEVRFIARKDDVLPKRFLQEPLKEGGAQG